MYVRGVAQSGLGHLNGVQGVPGSNPGAPTLFLRNATENNQLIIFPAPAGFLLKDKSKTEKNWRLDLFYFRWDLCNTEAMDKKLSIAYFSIEIALKPEIPTYSGGLGILAGDTIRGCADRNLPIVGVTLLHRKGYFRQRLDSFGWQTEEPDSWKVEEHLEEMEPRVKIIIEGRTVFIRAWKYEVKGVKGATVPVYLLDTDMPENSEYDRTLSFYLYGGDARYRLCQEAVLGMGGVKILRSLGHVDIAQFHMNEGHAALLVLELMKEHAGKNGRDKISMDDLQAARHQCVFTTHTPVPAGHDQFPFEMVRKVFGETGLGGLEDVFFRDGKLNMTYMALAASRYVNGVAKSHGEVSRAMFAPYEIDSITNGVHVPTWTSEPFKELFDEHIPAWRDHTYDTFSLRAALNIPPEKVWEAHMRAKQKLIDYVNKKTDVRMENDVFTVGFARRATAYKRADLLFSDIERLKTISVKSGKFQVIFAGKAHPNDVEGKQLITRIFKAFDSLKTHVKGVYLANYNWETGALMTAGVDLWLNTPHPPMEASGTSGMKAALNGVPSLSVLDGWWIEGCIEGKTGWAIDPGQVDPHTRSGKDAGALYDKLEKTIIPLYYNERNKYINIMSYAIALNGSFFNAQRMILQYVAKAYFK